LQVPGYCHTSPTSEEDEGKTMWSINGTQKEKTCCHANKLQHVTQSMLVANVTSIPSLQRPLTGNIKHRCNRYGSLSTWYRIVYERDKWLNLHSINLKLLHCVVHDIRKACHCMNIFLL
jgi:hypothetical protein